MHSRAEVSTPSSHFPAHLFLPFPRLPFAAGQRRAGTYVRHGRAPTKPYTTARWIARLHLLLASDAPSSNEPRRAAKGTRAGPRIQGRRSSQANFFRHSGQPLPSPILQALFPCNATVQHGPEAPSQKRGYVKPFSWNRRNKATLLAVYTVRLNNFKP